MNINDPVRGFYAGARQGTLPSVTFIDPHYIEFPPNANCDGPVADIRDGQILVQKIVEAVVTGPKWDKTLLIITYDEHGGFYDHVPPPPAIMFDNEPTSTYGVRVPAFVISPWVRPGQVFGHDAPAGTSNSLYFDHTSILKTIARRFMSTNPPYMGPRYAAAKDLTTVLGKTMQKTQFLPFVGYNLMYAASQKMLDVKGASSTPGTQIWQFDRNGSVAQDFSFEDAGNGFVYIRTNCGRLYVTVDRTPVVNQDASAAVPQGLAIKQDVKYRRSGVPTTPNQLNPNDQKWKLTPAGITVADKNFFLISNAAFANKVLQPVSTGSGVAVVLADRPAATGPELKAVAWQVTSPLVKDDPVVKQ